MLIEKVPFLYGQGFPKKTSPAFKLNQSGSEENPDTSKTTNRPSGEDFVSLSFNSRGSGGVTNQLIPDIEFDFDFNAKDFVIKVLNKETGDLIRQIPSEEFQRMAKQIVEFQEKFLETQTHQER